MAIGALVLQFEQAFEFFERGGIELAVRRRHGQLECLPGVAQIGGARERYALPRVAELLGDLIFQRAEDLLGPVEIHLARARQQRLREREFDIRGEQTDRAEHAGRGRHDHHRDLQRAREFDAVHAAIAAEGIEREIARIAPAIGRDALDGAHHVGVGHQ